MRSRALLLIATLVLPVSGAEASEAPGARVTSDSFKYLDGDGEIRIAPSWEEVPETFRSPLHWSAPTWCSESPTPDDVQQSIELQDIDADGQLEVLVYFDDECPNKRRFAKLEVIEADEDDRFTIVVTVNATRGFRPKPLDLDGDGRFELLGLHYGGAPELWVWDSGEYVDLVRGGTCFGSFWQEAMGKPGTPLEETLGRVLELYREGECRRNWPVGGGITAPAQLRYEAPHIGIATHQVFSQAGEPRLRDVFSMASAGANRLLVAGRDHEGRIVLRGVDLKTAEVVSLLSVDSFPSSRVRGPGGVSIGVAPVGGADGLNYVLFLYQLDDTTPYWEQYWTRLEVVLLDGFDPIWRAGPTELAKVRKASKEADPEVTYYASFARVLLGDVDADGHLDVVVWRKRCESVPPAEVAAYAREPWMLRPEDCRSGFRPVAEETGYFLYDPAARALGPLDFSGELPLPPVETLVKALGGWFDK